jgi:GMP synthase-like glutamine amidotransferase
MPGRVLVVQHVSHSSLGVYGEVLAERGDEEVWIRCHEGDRLPDRLNGFDAVISLGSDRSVYETDEWWLEPELRLLREAVDAGAPVWGICYGAQLLAAALGGRVFAGARPEVGVLPLRLTDAAAADPVFGSLPREVPMFHWHGDTFETPAGATLVAGSDAYPSQAFRAGALAYGVQFHAEATVDLVRGWLALPATRDQLEASAGPGAVEKLEADAERDLPAVNEVARTLMHAWRDAAEGH